jgi:SPP1 family predicted phage head-tail adaptor
MVTEPLIINPADLRHSIQIQERSTTQDQYGQPLEVWCTLITTRARIRTLSLREQFAQAGFSSQATHQITMRWQGSVPLQAGQRIVFGTRVFLVQSVENVLERNRVINLLVIEQQATQ